MDSQEAKEIYKEPVVNRDTGERVFVTPASFTHIFPDNARFKQNLARNIRAVPENAVLTHAEKATHGATNTSGVYTLFAAVRTDEGAKPVKIEVKDYINEGRELSKPIAEYFKQNGAENPYLSMYDGHVPELESVEEIKTEAVSSSAPRNSDFSARSKYPSTASTISIADFLPLVNRKFEKYLPKSKESSGKSEHSIADIIRLSPIEINKKTASAYGELSRQSQSSDMAVSSDDGKQLFGYTEPARAPQKTTTDTGIISHSGKNVNTYAEESSGKSEYSHADSQYGTKPQNSAGAQNREKALEMLKRGKDPQYMFTVTGWFRDDSGNLVVDHKADIYLYGKN